MTLLSQLRAAVERATADVLSKNFGTLATVLRQDMEDEYYLDSVVLAVEGLLNHAAALIAVADAAQHAVAVCGCEGSLDKLEAALAPLTKEG